MKQNRLLFVLLGLALVRCDVDEAPLDPSQMDEPVIDVFGPEDPYSGPDAVYEQSTPEELAAIALEESLGLGDEPGPDVDWALEGEQSALDDQGELESAMSEEVPDTIEDFLDSIESDAESEPETDADGIATTSSGLVARHRPHWGSGAHGDSRCGTYGSLTYPSMRVFRWAGCHRRYYYRIGSSIRARGRAWVNAVDHAFRAWDRPGKCSPHWVNITRAPAGAHVSVEVEIRGRRGHCNATHTWYACVVRDRARSTGDQHWWLNLNSAHPYGVARAGRFDVQSLVTVELAHILYFAHGPRYSDSISTSNTAKWGAHSVRLGSADVCGFKGSSSTCSNCGNRRSLKTGDRAILNHLYANDPNGCSDPGKVRCSTSCGSGGGQVCASTHKWSSCSKLSACGS